MRIKTKIYLAVLFIMLLNLSVISYAADVSGVSSYAPQTSFNPLIDNQRIPDTLFFGVWEGTGWRTQYHPLDKDQNNPDNQNYVKTPIKALLQYDRFPKLSKVEALVKEAGTSGDYSKAKEELLKYYKEYRGIQSPQYNISAANPKWGASAYENIFHAQGYQYSGGEVAVSNKEAWYKMPVSTVTDTYALWALDKIGADVLVDSTNNPSGNKPYLAVTTSTGRVEIVPASEGTYIRAGVYGNRTYSTENTWKIREDGLPVSDFTSRTYLKFDISAYNFAGYKEAYICFYGKLNTADNSKTVRILNTYITVPGKISDFCWNSATISYCWNYTDQMFDRYDVFDWSPPPNAEYEWINSAARLPREFSNASKYVATKDIRYAKAAVEHILAYYQSRNEWQPRILDSAWRAQNLEGTFFLLLNSDYLTPEVCTMFLKMVEYTAQICKYAPLSQNNQGSVFVASAIDLSCYFPELVTQDYWAYTIKRAKDLYNNLVYPNYGGYIEADAGGYTTMVINHIMGIIKNIRDIRGEVPEKFWYDKLDNMLRYRTNYLWPNMVSPNYADGGGDSPASTISSAATFLNLDAIKYGYPEYEKSSQEYLWIVNQGKIGTKPNYTSALIPKSKMWIMKTYQNDANALALSGNDDNTSYHKHDDALNIDVYAYGKLLLREIGKREYSLGADRGVLPSRAAYHNTITWMNSSGVLQSIPITSEANRDNSEIINEWISTDTIDYVDANTNSLNGINKSVSRKILFLKELGFWVVSDFVKNTSSINKTNYTFTQTWSPNLYHNATVDPITKAMRTHYADNANIFVVPADPGELSWVTGKDLIDPLLPIIYNGEPFSYQLIDFDPSTKLMYAKQQQAAGDVSFDTVLYPVVRGDNSTAVSVGRLPVYEGVTAINKEIATALEISINQNEKAYYYNSQDKSGTVRKFGDYSTDGNVAFVDKDEVSTKLKTISLLRGSYIRDENAGIDLLKSNTKFKDIALSLKGQIVDITSTEDISNAVFSFYCPEKVNKLYLNGVETNFEQVDNTVFIPNANQIKIRVRGIFVDGKTLDGFLQEKYDYDYYVTNTVDIPTISIDTAEQSTVIQATSLPGVTHITVFNSSDPSNKLEYTINFKFTQFINTDDTGSVMVEKITTDYENANHPATATMDNDKITYWEGHGANLSYLQYKTIRPINANGVSVMFEGGDVATYKFKVDVSTDGKVWQEALPETISVLSNLPVKYSFSQKSNVQYIRITITDNKWYRIPWVSFWGDRVS